MINCMLIFENEMMTYYNLSRQVNWQENNMFSSNCLLLCHKRKPIFNR
jgi:hypothetical protein